MGNLILNNQSIIVTMTFLRNSDKFEWNWKIEEGEADNLWNAIQEDMTQIGYEEEGKDY